MMGNGQADKLDFNALVARCAGPDGNEQESYLARVVMKVLIEHFGRDTISQTQMFFGLWGFAKTMCLLP